MRLKLVRSLLALAAATSLALPGRAVGQGAARGYTTDARVYSTALDPLLRPVTVEATGIPLGTVLSSIASQANLGLVYDSDAIPVDQVVTLRVYDTPAGVALRRALAGTNVDFFVSRNKQVVLYRRQGDTPRQEVKKPGVIIGRVTEVGTNAAIAGAQILVDSVGRAITNPEGMYRVSGVTPGKHTVSVISIGHRGASREVEVAEGATVLASFALEPAPTQLSELVVTAAGEKVRRVEIGNDIVVINADSIVQREPITSVADLLEGRVPGLIVQRSSGTPGDPTRIRIRGVSSPNLSNDPIIIVDGVRVYSDQSGARSSNLANAGTTRYNAPSPLDYISPSIIESIQVIKGPSAATMYGQDAANGVIVITTKRGRPGNSRWTVTMDRGTSRLPTDFPMRYVRFGRSMTDDRRVVCPANGWLGGNPATGEACLPDADVISFQALRDPNLTVLGNGENTSVNIGVSGGVSSFTYSVNASYRDEVGIVKLSRYETNRFRQVHGADPFDWMRRPQRFEQWTVHSNIQSQVRPTFTVSLTSTLSHNEQQRSELERDYMKLNDVYFERSTGNYYKVGGIVLGGVSAALIPVEVRSAFYERATASATRFTNALEMNWRPRTWLTLNADAGLSVDHRSDDIFVPTGYDLSSTDRADGLLRRANGNVVTSTINIRAFGQIPLGLGFNLRLASGVNYKGESIADMVLRASALPEGVGSIIDNNDPIYALAGGERRSNISTYGWYIEPGIAHRRMWLNLGIRLDGGSNFGSNVKLPAFPKLSYSYLISDEPFFPDALRSVFSELRLRAAYGHAGRQPGPTDRLRLYSSARIEKIGGVPVEVVDLSTLGNTELKPERSQEFEGGFDAGLFDDRVSLVFTAYQKTTKDALLSVPVAPSVYGGGITRLQNIGVVRNAGMEFSVNFEPVRRDFVSWRVGLNISQNRNKVLELGEGVEPFWTEQEIVRYGGMPTGVHGLRVVPGYPLFGRWSTPVLGYADANGNGVLDPNEVIFGDTAVYVGHTLPKYAAGLNTNVSLFRGVLSIGADLTYTDGMTQWNQALNPVLTRGWNDPNATSLFDQLLYYDKAQFSRIETVYALRLENLSVAWQMPRQWAARVGANSLTLSLQGSNLGLLTNYSGIDPNVNSSVGGNGVQDGGALPTPRRFQIRLNANF